MRMSQKTLVVYQKDYKTLLHQKDYIKSWCPGEWAKEWAGSSLPGGSWEGGKSIPRCTAYHATWMVWRPQAMNCRGHTKLDCSVAPQPQMYPPVALNQYTLVNRTHKHYIYIYIYIYIYTSKPQKHLKITPKLNNMQNMEVIWWTIFQIFVFILWGLGEAYVESRGTKVSRRHHHTGYICTTRKNNGNHGRGQ